MTIPTSPTPTQVPILAYAPVVNSPLADALELDGDDMDAFVEALKLEDGDEVDATIGLVVLTPDCAGCGPPVETGEVEGDDVAEPKLNVFFPTRFSSQSPIPFKLTVETSGSYLEHFRPSFDRTALELALHQIAPRSSSSFFNVFHGSYFHMDLTYPFGHSQIGLKFFAIRTDGAARLVELYIEPATH